MLEESELQELKTRLKEEFSEYYEIAGGKNYRYHHLVSTRKHVKKIMGSRELENSSFDEEVVEVAALFHDIGRKMDIEDGEMDPIKNHEGHAETGAQIVMEYTQDVIGKRKSQKVREIIERHHSEPETVEGKILQDADLLTNYGVSDIWRMIHYSSDKERTHEEAFEYFWETHQPRYTERLQEFHFDFSREWAKDRLLKHQKTIREMEKEFQASDI